MGKKVTVHLAEDEYTTLKMWVSSGKTEHRLVNRAQVFNDNYSSFADDADPQEFFRRPFVDDYTDRLELHA